MHSLLFSRTAYCFQAINQSFFWQLSGSVCTYRLTPCLRHYTEMKLYWQKCLWFCVYVFWKLDCLVCPHKKHWCRNLENHGRDLILSSFSFEIFQPHRPQTTSSLWWMPLLDKLVKLRLVCIFQCVVNGLFKTLRIWVKKDSFALVLWR